MNITQRITFLTVFAAIMLSATDAQALTETVNGITWTYTVSNGVATVGGSGSSYLAVPTSTSGAIIIPSTLDGYSVTSIGNEAFYWCNGLLSLTIPDSVASIGDYAFYGCSSLTNFSVGINNMKYSSSNGVLLSKDGGKLIAGINGDVAIPNSVKSIGRGAFYCYGNLTSVSIPDSVTNIESSAFSGCSRLMSLTMPDSIMSIGNFAFSGCSGLMSLTIQDGMISIGDYAFYSCNGLTSLRIPESVAHIGNMAFDGCHKLTETRIIVQNMAEWALNTINSNLSGTRRLFINGKEVTDVVIPDSVKYINDYAFQNCKNLTSVIIPENVNNIGKFAFSGCSNLKSVTFLGDSNLVKIDKSAFLACESLTSEPKSKPKSEVTQQSSDNSSEASAEQGMKAMAAVLGILGTMSQMAEAERANEQGQREAAAAARAEDGYGRLYGGDNDGDNSRMQRQLEEQQRQIRQLQEQQQQKSSRVKICPYCGGSGRFGVSGHQLRDTPLGEALMPCQRCRGTGVMPDE